MGQRNEAIGTVLMNAKVYENVRKNNINEDTSFNSLSESIQKTLNQPNSAIIYHKYVVDNHAENDCKVDQLKTLALTQFLLPKCDITLGKCKMGIIKAI